MLFSDSDSVIAVRDFPSFERRQVLPLEVLDQRQLHDLRVVGLPQDHRQLPEAHLHRGVVPPLAGDDLIAAAFLTDDQRLDHALLGNRRHQLGQVAHHLARLVGVRVEQLDGHHLADRGAGGRRQRLDIVLVMPHPQRVRQSALRHVR
jgi:hypothetical protein